jgi:hypothetical protein
MSGILNIAWLLSLFITEIETTDEIYIDWISEFMGEMRLLMHNAARSRSHNMGEYIGISTNDKTDGSADQKLTLMLMRWV